MRSTCLLACLLLSFVSLSTGCGSSDTTATINPEAEKPKDTTLDPSFYSDDANMDPNAAEQNPAK